MTTDFISPLGKLSRVKNFSLDLLMKGKHLEELSLSDKEDYDRAVLSVLSDLIKGIDVYNLSFTEIYHAFLLVKVSTLGPRLKTQIKCPHMIEDKSLNIKRSCETVNDIEFTLIDSDVEICPSDYKIPTVIFAFDGVEKEYKVIPPTSRLELDLISWFQERGIQRSSLVNPSKDSVVEKQNTLEYFKHRMLLHLVSEDGSDFSDRKLRERAVKDFSDNPVSLYQELSSKVKEVSKFGVYHNHNTIKCKGCGGTLTFRLSLSSGLPM